MSTILQLNAGVNYPESTTRMLAQEVIDAIRTPDTQIVVRDLTVNLPSVFGIDLLNATRAAGTSPAELAALAESDTLVDELVAADTVVIAAPLYNFSIPATLKLWIDQIARAGRTFSYSDRGPVGLLTGKRAFVVIASGGVPLGSPMDFASPYLKAVLGFVGIADVTIIEAGQMSTDPANGIELARKQIGMITR
jgi:FMN-dependent NADH-azoreductase